MRLFHWSFTPWNKRQFENFSKPQVELKDRVIYILHTVDDKGLFQTFLPKFGKSIEIFIFSIKVGKIVFLEKFKLEIKYLERSILSPIFV